MERFEYLIIGAGPGGYEVAARLARRGHSVALIERELPGGTCLNRGCIPTKCLCATASTLLTLRKAAVMGVTVDGTVAVDYPAALSRMHGVVDGLRGGVESLLRGVALVHGEARFLPDGSVEAAGRVFCADKILISTGSRPAILPVEGAGYAVTSDDILEKDMPLPARLTIIGAGVIGIEFASIFSAMGVDVTVVEYCKEILPMFDTDIAKRLRMALQGRGVSFVLGASVQSIGADRTVRYTGKKGDAVVEGDLVMMAVGRWPVVPEGAREAGIELTDRGFVAVDADMQTTRPGVYAAGDVTGICMLAHVASAQARKALLGIDVRMDIIPSAVFSEPEAAMVGLTAAECDRRGIPYATARASYASNGKALAGGAASGSVKMLYDPDTRLLLGVQVLGEHASDLVAECAALMYAGVDVDAVADKLIHAHPTLSELIPSALSD